MKLVAKKILLIVCLSGLGLSPVLGAVDDAGLAAHHQVAVPGSWFVEVDLDRVEPIREAIANAGGDLRFQYDLVPGLWNVRDLNRAAAELLSEVPGVIRVFPDYEVQGSMMESAGIIGATPAQKSSAGFAAIDGSGVRICIVDSGVRHDHMVFQGRSDTSADLDLVNNDNDASDDDGHGTHVAATAAGGNEFTVGGDPWQGIAHEATIVSVKVLNASGSGTASNIVAGIQHCADQSASGGRADVVNLSLGGGLFASACDSDPMAQAANNAVDAGLVVVAASGNDCHNTAVSSPACGSKVMAVGATWDSAGANGPRFGCFRGTCSDKNYQPDDLVCFSNESALLSVVAPGGAITSASHTSTSAVDTYYGTSQATPHVAGLAALLLDQDPGRNPIEVRLLIQDGAVDLGSPGFDSTFGHGRIDVLASLDGTSCGDGTCDAPGEDVCSCPIDCGSPPGSETSCSDGVDNDCDGALDCLDVQDCQLSADCPCGNGTCAPDEDSCSCPADCGQPPATEADCSDGVDNDCDGAADAADSDCSGGAVCGDGVCEGGSEDCLSCSTDCRRAKGGVDCCGDGQCTGTEKARNCPVDCL